MFSLLPATSFTRRHILPTTSLLLLASMLSGSGLQASPSRPQAASSFREVVEVLRDNAPAPSAQVAQGQALAEWNAYRTGQLPQYDFSSTSIFGSAVSLENDARRTLTDRHDTYDYLPKKLHPNGVCGWGTWEIDRDLGYSGLFRKDTKALFIGRISVAMGETARADMRGFGFAGKVFPTQNPDEPVTSANFFTVDVLMGQEDQSFLTTSTTNEPETGFRFSVLWLGLRIARALSSVEENPGFRPLTQLAEAGEASASNVRQPKYIRLRPIEDTLLNSESDFRSEVLRGVQDNRGLRFDIHVSDVSADRHDESHWKRVGRIRLADAAVSFGCDRRLHFSHPRLR
ncbi:MAG TPA: hypothetical protein PLZ57_07415 [Pseudobdellovibrionaceae bacterium]|nr:hypothetical protein [Pseudobdellovibrionaceae bacterium]